MRRYCQHLEFASVLQSGDKLLGIWLGETEPHWHCPSSGDFLRIGCLCNAVKHIWGFTQALFYTTSSIISKLSLMWKCWFFFPGCCCCCWWITNAHHVQWACEPVGWLGDSSAKKTNCQPDCIGQLGLIEGIWKENWYFAKLGNTR